MLTKSCLDICAKFGVLDKALKQILPDKVCCIRPAMTCRTAAFDLLNCNSGQQSHPKAMLQI